MLINEGTTAYPSRNSSPDIILVVANPDTGCPSRGGHLEALEGVSIPITATFTTLTIKQETETQTPCGTEGTHDGHHEGDQGKREPNQAEAL